MQKDDWQILSQAVIRITLFSCFKANAKEFEIQKRQNHYKIIARTATPNEEVDEVVLKGMRNFA